MLGLHVDLNRHSLLYPLFEKQPLTMFHTAFTPNEIYVIALLGYDAAY
jgi:hypothetical protein